MADVAQLDTWVRSSIQGANFDEYKGYGGALASALRTLAPAASCTPLQTLLVCSFAQIQTLCSLCTLASLVVVDMFARLLL